MIATHHPKPDRLFPSTKTAIAPTTQHPIAHFPHQTTIAPTTHKPDRKFLKSNSDRPSTPNTRSPISLIKHRSRPQHPQTRSPISLKIKQRSHSLKS
ncbi:MAG: hypothetical protein ACK47J_11370 [Pseudanabaena sp.]